MVIESMGCDGLFGSGKSTVCVQRRRSGPGHSASRAASSTARDTEQRISAQDLPFSHPQIALNTQERPFAKERVVLMAQRSASKHGLHKVLAAGVLHEYAQAQRNCGVLFDVVSSNGEPFGLCVRIEDGRHLYVEPKQLEGVVVSVPMLIRPHANRTALMEALSSGLRHELRM